MYNLMQPPFYYDHMNLYNTNFATSTIHANDTQLAKFFEKYLLERAMSVYEWDLPDSYNRYYFKYVLFTFGFIALFNDSKYGQVCQQCTLKGYDLYYYPREVIITNPAWENAKELRIDKDCILLNLKGDFTGVLDLVQFYADQLAVLYESFGVNAMQAKNTDIYGCADKKSAEELKKTTDLVLSGKPAVFVTKDLFGEDGTLFVHQFKQAKDFFGDTLLDCVRVILNNFDAEIGIPTAPEKRERLISNEVNSKSYEAMTRSEMWLEDLKKECEKARNLLGINIDVNFRYNVFDELADSNESGFEGGVDV